MSKEAPTRPKSSLSAFVKLREQEAARMPAQLSPAHQELKPISERDSKLNSSSSMSSSNSSSQSADENNKPGQSLSILNEIPKQQFSLSGMSSPNYSPGGSPGQTQGKYATPSKFGNAAEPMFNPLPNPRFQALNQQNTLNTPNFLKEYRYRRKDSKTLVKEGGNDSKEIHQMAQPFVRRSIRSSTSSEATVRSIPLHHEAQDDKANISDRKLQGNNRRDETQPIGSCVVSDLSDDEEMTEERIALRKKLKKGLFVSYFLGILFSMKNRVKIYGALRSVEHVKQFEVNKTEKRKHHFLPFLPTDCFTVVWTILLIILLILTALLTPYRVSFIDDDDPTWQVIDRVFDVWFGVDMVFSFLSAYEDPVLGLVTSFKAIAIRYLKKWFWIDLAAILPFDDIFQAFTAGFGKGNLNKLLRLLRISRIYRLLKILRLFKALKVFTANQYINRTIKKLNLNIGIMKILRVLINILFLNHFVSCIWFYMSRLEDFDPDTWVVRTGLRDSDAWSQYIASYYWAFQTLTTVGFGDIPPKTFLERILSIIWMIIGVGFYSFTIGNLSTILANIDKKSAVLKNKLTAFNNFAIKVKMPEFLRQKVQRFFELNHKENVYYWMDPQEMLKELPANLRTSLLLYSYYGMIKNIRLLQLDANFTASILTYLKLLKLKKGETLYREGDPAEEVYFISKGAVKLVNEYGQSIYALTEGTYFGEVETLAEDKRISFCQATESTILLVCERESFLESLKDFPTIEMQIQRTVQTRKQKYLEKISQLREKAEATNRDIEDENRRKLMNSTEYFNKVIVSNFVKEKKLSAEPPKKPKKATAKVHIEPVKKAGYVKQTNPESTVLTNRDVVPELTTTPNAKKKQLEIVSEEKLSATSPKKFDFEPPKKPIQYSYGGFSPKDEERGLLDETGNPKSLSQNKDFMLSYTTDKEDPLILDADPVSTWRRKRQELKSPTFDPNAIQQSFAGRRFMASQDEIQEEEDEKEKVSKNSMGLVEDDEKEQKEGSSTDLTPPVASRGQENFRGRKYNNWLNQNKPTSQDALGEVKEENTESLSFDLKGSRLRLEESLIKENLSKIPTKEIVEEASELHLQDLQEAEKAQAKSKGRGQIKFDNLVQLMAQNMLHEDENSDQGSRVYEIEGEDESKFEDTFDNEL